MDNLKTKNTKELSLSEEEDLLNPSEDGKTSAKTISKVGKDTSSVSKTGDSSKIDCLKYSTLQEVCGHEEAETKRSAMIN